MANKELFEKLYELTDDKPVTIDVASRYACLFRKSEPRYDLHKTCYFTKLTKDDNSCSKMTYVNLDVFDKDTTKTYFGRLYMSANDDLVTDNRYGFMLYLKEYETDANWLTALSVSAASIRILLVNEYNMLRVNKQRRFLSTSY